MNRIWLAVWGVRAWTTVHQFQIYLNQDSLNGLDQVLCGEHAVQYSQAGPS
jgi:hypothetical protein